MAGNVEAAADAFEDEVVHVEDLGKLRGDRFQSMFEFGVANQFFRALNRGRLAFDMGENIRDFGDILPHLGFQFGYLIVRVLEGHPFIQFDVLLDVKVSGKILHADVVNVQVAMGGHGSDAIENVFCALRSRQGRHGDVSIRQDAANRFCYRADKLARPLEGNAPGEPYGKVREITIPGAPYADPVDLEHAIDTRYCVVNLRAYTRRSGIEQSIDGAPS